MGRYWNRLYHRDNHNSGRCIVFDRGTSKGLCWERGWTRYERNWFRDNNIDKGDNITDCRLEEKDYI